MRTAGGPSASTTSWRRVCFPVSALSYHGRDQRGLKEQFARLYEPYFRDQPPPAGSGLRDRKRIGILVTRRHEGMFLQSMRGIIEQLDGDRFETGDPLPRGPSWNRSAANSAARTCGSFPSATRFPSAIRQVRAAACDLIYYWEVGSDAMNYFLPFARLRPCNAPAGARRSLPACRRSIGSFPANWSSGPVPKSQYTERLWKSRTLFRYQAPPAGHRRPPCPPTSACPTAGICTSAFRTR